MKMPARLHLPGGPPPSSTRHKSEKLVTFRLISWNCGHWHIVVVFWLVSKNLVYIVNHLDWTSAHLHQPIIERGLCPYLLVVRQNLVKIETTWVGHQHIFNNQPKKEEKIKSFLKRNTEVFFFGYVLFQQGVCVIKICLFVYSHWLKRQLFLMNMSRFSWHRHRLPSSTSAAPLRILVLLLSFNFFS